jgi:hypothetical protein
MGLGKRLTPSFIRDRYLDIKRRLEKLEVSVRCLDMAVDAFVVSPRYTPGEEIGFNGQSHRKRMFADIVSAIGADCIVETGTWLGNTTGYMAETYQKPVYSCEISPRFHALAKMRLAGLPNIHLELGDSRQFLRKLAQTGLAGQSVFFYLDAHWYEDLPLETEVGLISANWHRFAIMIDDFKVPDDPGYTYDAYGKNKLLELRLLGKSIANLSVYFPAAGAAEETGDRRGCVVLAPNPASSGKLDAVRSLRRWRNGRD